MNTRILIGIITSGLQTLVYYLFFYTGWTVGTMIYEPTTLTISEAVGFGAFLKFSIIVFGVVMLSMNLIDAIVNQKKWTWRLLILVSIFYLVYWGQGINYIPYKTGLFVVTGLIAIFSKIPIEEALDKLTRMRTRTNAKQRL